MVKSFDFTFAIRFSRQRRLALGRLCAKKKHGVSDMEMEEREEWFSENEAESGGNGIPTGTDAGGERGQGGSGRGGRGGAEETAKTGRTG